MKIRALGKYVTLQLDEEESSSKHGIIIPEAHRDKSTFATIITVGSGVPKELGLQKGTRVLVAKYGTMKVEIDRLKRVYILGYEYIFGVIPV